MSIANDSALAERYQAQAYASIVFSFSHPDRLAAIARLHGLEAADPQTARVLEIGCASGLNLLSIAACFPSAELLGIDLDGVAIQKACQRQKSLGLENIRFEQSDLLEWDSDGLEFDYIIAHGFFSWVPDSVKEQLLVRIQQCLAPNGVALISYLTQPGSMGREAARDFLALHTSGNKSPHKVMERAREAAHFLSALTSSRNPPGNPLAPVADYLLRKNPDVLFHDELGPIYDPCYFLQFMEWAGEHGLQFLSEARLVDHAPEIFPEAARRLLDDSPIDRLRLEQYRDYAANRSFRRSLLCPAAARLSPVPDASAVKGFSLSLNVRLSFEMLDLSEGVSMRFETPSGVVLTTSEPVAKAAYCLLSEIKTVSVSFQELLRRVTATLDSLSLPNTEDTAKQLSNALLLGAYRGLLDLSLDGSLSSGQPLSDDHPFSRLQALLAEEGLPALDTWRRQMRRTNP
ncbi:MAG: methyltransferase regulatory domain-containing protein [Opitutales bacterium]|nr:methyltransferase regulatory domain-containing protein [Opitutales bacterium]